MSEHGKISFNGDELDQAFENVIDYLQNFDSEVIEKATRIALPKAGDEVARIARGGGPRSRRHRKPGKRGQQSWRNQTMHAIDTIRRSGIRKEKETGRLYVQVGPQRGDNTPSFYLKFHEYGWLWHPGRPFMRPAAMTSRSYVEAEVRAAVNKMIAKGIGGK